MSNSVLPPEARAREALARGDLAQAATALKEVLKADPRAEWAYNDLTQVLFTMGRRGDAEQVARTALRLNPRNAQAHNLFGTILSELNDLPSGEWHFRRALELGGPEARFFANLALNLMQQGRTEEAERNFAAAEQQAPGDVKTLAHWSKLYEVRGELERAQELLERAQAAGSAGNVDLLRANHLVRAGRYHDALAILEAAPRLNGDAQLERGRLYDRLERFDEAWRDFIAAKTKLAAEGGGLKYQAEAVETFFARLKRFCTRANLALLPRASVRRDVAQPIFVMGFPRSGTTLIEQVLTSHSTVRPGGELAYVAEFRKLANLLFAGQEPFPENLGRMWTADNRHAAALFRDHYFGRAELAGLLEGPHAFFTDKMPFNEIWLPLVRVAFPHARIVHIVRHPLDVCVSMMANNMTHGFNCGYRIEDAVHHLAAVSDLVGHYRREMEIGDYVLKYESFIADQRAETERLLAYLGLPFEEGCLSFHENRRYARTPSYAQVTEKLNDRSIGRHRHYAAHLAPHLPGLARLIAAQGYDAAHG